jgi:hypothetical protein
MTILLFPLPLFHFHHRPQIALDVGSASPLCTSTSSTTHLPPLSRPEAPSEVTELSNEAKATPDRVCALELFKIASDSGL